MIPCEATKIHGPHGVHGFYLKILLKIFVKMSSIPDAIPQKPLPRSEVFERIFSRDFLLKIILAASLNDDYISCRRQHLIKQDFLQDFLRKQHET